MQTIWQSAIQAIVVHGGPGAIGSCAGICRELADEFGVLEILVGSGLFDAKYYPQFVAAANAKVMSARQKGTVLCITF